MEKVDELKREYEFADEIIREIWGPFPNKEWEPSKWDKLKSKEVLNHGDIRSSIKSSKNTKI